MLAENENYTEMINEKDIIVQEQTEINYDNLSIDELIEAISDLNDEQKIQSHKKEIENIKRAFYTVFDHEISKTDQLTDEAEITIVKDQLFGKKYTFESQFHAIKNIQKAHFKKVKNDQTKNLEERLALIEELKELVSPENTVTNKFSAFNAIKERWNNAGPCPKDKYNHVWNNYYFHVENLFDYIHLDKEARDLEFKQNYEKKITLLKRMEELLTDSNLKKSLDEVKLIQKSWREDIGPVERTKREELWAQFDAINEKVALRKKELKVYYQGEEKINLSKKTEIIQLIHSLTEETKESVDFWNTQSEKLNACREAFLAIGRTPKEHNDATWTSFRNALKEFNEQKNNYFKTLREVQNKTIEKKKALILKAKSFENSTDWAKTTDLVKRLQSDWKKSGHVPAKFSNALWKEFKTSCDLYFERLNAQRDAENEQELLVYNDKLAFLQEIETTKLDGDPKKDLEIIQAITQKWNDLGRVPFSKKGIQDDFKKQIDVLYGQIKMDRAELEIFKFKNNTEQLVANGDSDKINDEYRFIAKKVTEIKSEIIQLENNILFLTSSSKKESPFITEVKNNIQKHKDNLVNWETKLHFIKIHIQS